jgi:competence protein ComEA
MRGRLFSVLGDLVTRFGYSRLVGTAVGVAVTAVGVWWVVRVPPPPIESTIPMATVVATSVGPVGITGAPTEIVVHVAGEVVSPGVYELAPGSRMVDALDAAGGPTRHADLDAVNLAAPINDAEQVFVPRRGATPRRATGGVTGGATGKGQPVVATDGLINLNVASASELDELPGIGPQTAQAIVEHRTRNGPFLSVEELLDVRGIGPSKLAALRERVRV